MGFIAKLTGASAVAEGQVVNARVNKAGEVVSMPWRVQMALEGRVYIAGTGLEEAGVAGIASINEQTPIFALVAPAGGVVMIPLWIRVYYDTEAAGVVTMHWYYCQLDKAAFSAGTTLPAINCLGGDSPRSAQGRLLSTLTSLTAITAAQNVVIEERAHVLAQFQSAEADASQVNQQTPGGNNTFEQVTRPAFPIGLYAGSMLAFSAIDATARYNVAASWIELPSDSYLP